MIFIIVAVVLIAIFLYPYTFYPLSLMLLPKVKARKAAVEGGTVTLLFCAFNEERALPEKLQNIRELKLRYPDLEILAYDDGSTDRTLELLGSCSDILKVVQGGGRQGKASGMKLMAAQATGDLLVFTDANVVLAPDAIENLRNWFADPAIGGVCGVLRYHGDETSSTAVVGGLYWRLEERIKQLESGTGNVMGADGSIFAIRKALYPKFPNTVLDDLTVSMEPIFRGYRLAKADDVVAFEGLVANSADEFARKVRISARAYHTHLYLLPQLRRMKLLDRYKYMAHKVVRWWGGPLLVLAGIAALIGAAEIGIEAFLLLLALILLGGLIVARSKVRIASSLREIFLAIIATTLGILRALRGKTYATWSPAKSR